MLGTRTRDDRPATFRSAWLVPFAALAAYTVLLALPATRAFARELSLENRPIELLTFGLLLAAALLSFDLARRCGINGERPLVCGFYALFGLAMLVVGMEEVAWGQTFFGWSTPEAWRAVNAQQETTLHNHQSVQRLQPAFRMAFALGGLLGVWLARFPALRPIAAPPAILPWLVAIGLQSLMPLYPLITDREPRFDRFLRVLSEMTELLIAVAATMYVVIKRRMLAQHWQRAASPI